jgi:SAM-dependent methyltransferase
VATVTRFRPAPAARYIHPKAAALVEHEGEHDASLEISSESAPNYLSWVASLCNPHLGRRVLEVGAGIGAITARYEHGRDVVANDVSARCVTALRERFADRPNVRVEDRDLRSLELGERFDSVLMVNVLEHIIDDVEALKGLSRLLAPGGKIVVYVPALNGLYGPWDETIGHYRRYSIWRLREVFKQADLDPIELRWVNFLAIPAWAAFSRGDVEDQGRSGKLLRLWDRTAVPVARFVESRVRVPIGLNVFGVGRLRV